MAEDKKTVEELFSKYSEGFFSAVEQDLNQYQFTPGFTFERDCMSFLYGRYIVLAQALKQSEGKDFTIAEASYHLGSAFAGFLEELEKTTELIDDNFLEKAQEVFEIESKKGFKLKIDDINHRRKTISNNEQD